MLDTYTELQSYAYWDRVGQCARWSDERGLLDLTLSLHVQLAEQRLQRVSNEEHSTPPEVTIRRKQSIHKKLQQVCPGAAATIAAVADHDGNVYSDDASIASVLASYWAEIFAARPVEQGDFEAWAARVLTLLPDASYEVTEAQIDNALKFAKDSAPGPDGIPYSAYPRSKLVIGILLEAAKELAHGKPPPYDFNYAFLCLLPKKPSGVDAGGNAFYSGENTRPLSIVNTDNRLLASAFRLVVEAPFARWVSFPQRGFIRGRSMIENILDIDASAVHASLLYERACLVLFDFKAAFPSISHAYMWKVLERIRLPAHLLRAFQGFYQGNMQWVKLRGVLAEGFNASTGVRQGCPLSPIIFAVVVDILLRKLLYTHASITLRAFADDIGIVFQRFGDTRAVFADFVAFGRFSGLILNLPKTVLVPLWKCSLPRLRRVILDDLPELAGIELSFSAKYLGWWTGPEGRLRIWDEAVAKYIKAVRRWATGRWGFALSVKICNTYLQPILGFIAQIAPPDGRGAPG